MQKIKTVVLVKQFCGLKHFLRFSCIKKKDEKTLLFFCGTFFCAD